MQLPAGRISGKALKALVTAVRHTPVRHITSRVLRKQLGIEALLALDPAGRGPLLPSQYPVQARESHERPSAKLPIPEPETWPRTAASLDKAYRSKQLRPEQIVELALAGARRLATRTPSIGPLLSYDDERALEAARGSAERLEQGSARPLEGIPVAIKEEVDVQGLPTRLGTGWMPNDSAAADCVAVARLRAAGAVIIGTTPMTEYGMSPLGCNPHREIPRNPHDPSRLPGGSSSGSGVAVATGVVPMALGADGGGSIRIPACLNGVFGLKPTFGRIPTTGHGLPTGSSVVHLGPLGSSVRDLALFMEATSGADAGDLASLLQPKLEPGSLMRALGRGVKGLRIGIEEQEWSAARSDVSTPAREALRTLEREGAELVPVEIPLARHAAPIGYLTIGLETANALRGVAAEHFDELGSDLQLLLLGLDTFGAGDYLEAQRQRSELRRQLTSVLTEVDVLALPTTGAGAPSVTHDEATGAFVDPEALDGVSRYAYIGNLTGLPAGTAPVGLDAEGLPVGLQIIGDAWDEAAVLQTMTHLERTEVARVLPPMARIDLLDSARVESRE